ncbi:putative transcription factor C3H family [Helianthus annuus]|uniref:Putative zinc finger, CCCH-type n=1 Tax=Helianthus annuus TaxID=4232 RepID=A0A251TYG0_HELAN|nr:zinc finger CCCH domain-containing protein 6 [Helianthus annuus]XP_021982377.1 zinc finger CCCH domain-containing protein 6 [Helianthus annuus]XP_021982379.1 zinc finger CCCH domain-containing protein 6 [Helianthus annuus]XP_035833433.1 zinc finger CCCH domain-containing protein 6 [Helianthus annuus]XP_035833434.1 zinc finger CCCH domain-containing protein 6 [Helianthus annuus]KAF5790782.1 putative transcription factor C3H family [Helianthus annuus]KAJ0534244.1 putative transcription facto
MLIGSMLIVKFYPAGLCKYGDSCRFNHSILEADNLPLQVNYLGYPKRLGKMNCSFYMRTGMCGYGVSCRFHHPNPIVIFTPGPMSNHKEAVNLTQSHLSLPLAPKGKEKIETAEDYTPKKRALCSQ